MNTHNCLIKHINRGWAFTLVLVFYSLLSFSQSTETLSSIAQSLADIYDLEGDNVPTGYLSDRAVDLVGLHKYDGQSLCDSNYVSPVIFRDLLRTIDTLSSGAIVYGCTRIYNNQLQRYSLSKKVLTHFPDMQLTVNQVSTNQYEVSAECVSAYSGIENDLDEIAAGGGIKFIWGYKNANNSYDWTDTTSVRSFICSPPQGELSHVCMKLHCCNTREGNINIVDIDRRIIEPFFFEPTDIVVSDTWQICNYSVISDPRIIGHEYFSVWHNSDYANTVDDPDCVTIGNVTIPLTTSYSKTINGVSTTVYCFSIMSCSPVQSAITQTRANYIAGLYNTLLLPIHIKHGSTTLQTCYLPFVPGSTNLP